MIYQKINPNFIMFSKIQHDQIEMLNGQTIKPYFDILGVFDKKKLITY